MTHLIHPLINVSEQLSAAALLSLLVVTQVQIPQPKERVIFILSYNNTFCLLVNTTHARPPTCQRLSQHTVHTFSFHVVTPLVLQSQDRDVKL